MGLSVLLTGRLAFCIGYHSAYNFFLANVFGWPFDRWAGSTTSFLRLTWNRMPYLSVDLEIPWGYAIWLAADLLAIGLLLLWLRIRDGRIRLCTDLTEPRLHGRDT
jgi:hypothetical protein